MKYIRALIYGLFLPFLGVILFAINYKVQIFLIHRVFPGLSNYVFPNGEKGADGILGGILAMVASLLIGAILFEGDEKTEAPEEDKE